MNAELVSDPVPREGQTTVLVVEDEVLIRLMVADALRAQGLTVIEASNSDEALRVLQSAVPIHLLLTDIRMPSKMDGLMLARVVRSTHPHIKLVIASSQRINGDLGVSADAVFCKPYDIGVVVRRIKHLLAEAEDVARRR